MMYLLEKEETTASHFDVASNLKLLPELYDNHHLFGCVADSRNMTSSELVDAEVMWLTPYFLKLTPF